jgi:hexokinase
LSACAIAGVILQTEKDKETEPINVGVDGSVVEHYPRFEERVRQALKEVLGESVEKRIVIGLAKDGSGVGGERYPIERSLNLITSCICLAALCALQAKKQRDLGLTV